MTRLAAVIEALLFTSGAPVGMADLARWSAETEPGVRAALAEVQAALEGHGVELCAVAGGFQLRTRSEFAGAVAQVVTTRHTPLSRAALETLAVIAFRQPVTRADVDQLRGVHSEGTIATLVERELIQEAGRADAPGRPILYRTTRRFLEYFGLRHLRELRSIEILPPEA